MIPTHWDHISTRQYMLLNKSLKKPVPETAGERLDLLIERTMIITQLPLEDALKTPLTELQKVEKLLKTPLPTKIYKEFKLNGVWYEFTLNPKEINSEQFAGIKEAIKEDPEQGYAMAMYYLAKPFKNSIVNRILKRKYIETDPADVVDVIESFHDLPITVSRPVCLFFLTVSEAYKNYSAEYSKNQMKTAKQKLDKAVTDLVSVTVGSKQ